MFAFSRSNRWRYKISSSRLNCTVCGTLNIHHSRTQKAVGSLCLWQCEKCKRHSLDLHANSLHIARYYALGVNMLVMDALSLQTALSLLGGIKIRLEEADPEDMPNISVAHSSPIPALHFCSSLPSHSPQIILSGDSYSLRLKSSNQITHSHRKSFNNWHDPLTFWGRTARA